MNEATKAAAVDRIAQIAEHLGRVAPALIMDLHDQITQAITALVEESQDAANEEPPRTVKPVITIPFSVKWDINRTTVEVKASVSTKTTAEASIELDDPNQPTLPGVELTIETGGGHTAKLDAASLRKGIQAVDRALAAGLTPDDVSAAIAVAKTMKKEGGGK